MKTVLKTTTAALLTALVLPATATAQSSGSFGNQPEPQPSITACPQDKYGTTIPFWDSPERITTALDKAVEQGATYIRLDLAWSHIEEQRGTYEYDLIDNVINEITSRGLTPLAILTYTPKWAATHPHINHSAPDPQYLPEWEKFVSTTVQRYKGQITDWEIWNEPNIDHFWAPQPSGKDYVPFLKKAYTAIKKIQPGDASTVLSAGLAPAGNEPGAQGAHEFFSEMYDHGAQDYFDEAAMHPYTYPADPTDPNREGSGNNGEWKDGWATTLDMRAEMVERGDSDKSMWLTEYGMPTGTNPRASTEARQAEVLKNSWIAARDIPWVEKVILYTMVDPGPNLYDVEHNFGMLRNDLSEKPSYHAIKEANAC